MKIGIDATNIKLGGGLTHLKNLIEYYTGNDEITIVGGEWLEEINVSEKAKLEIHNHQFDTRYNEFIFKFFKLKKRLGLNDISFIPGFRKIAIALI